MGAENPKDWLGEFCICLPSPGSAGDQPLISTSPPLQKQQFSTSSRDQPSSPQ